jgi:type IV pilus assembly protein PilQ
MSVKVLLAAACIAAVLLPALGPATAQAQAVAAANSVERLDATQTATGVLLTIQLKSPPKDVPPSFSVANPARIAIDLPGTDNNVGRNALEFNQGDLRSVNIVQAQERTRLVLNLRRSVNHSVTVNGNVVQVALGGLVDTTSFRAAEVSPAAPAAAPAAAAGGPRTLRSLDFRRGAEGEGRVLVDLSDPNISVDIRDQGNRVIVNFLNVSAPESLRRRLDVTDFGTPIAMVNTSQQGSNVRMVIEPRGMWEYNAYQSDTRFVVEVRPVKEDPTRLIQGTRPGYQGERLSLNFQNVEVRALLQVIADFTDLNIITSDSVGGSITLRLKDVPWDQALDIILQSKGLDMRKNGNVVVVAPREELAAKEKLDLEARSQIADLEPLRAESFVVNYQKAEDVRKLLVDSQQRMLSKRGTVVVDPRTNQMFVRDTAARLEEVRRLLQKIDVQVPQVLIEARIVEADDTFSRNLGVRLGGSSGYPRQVGGSSAYATGGGVGVPSTTGPGGTVGTTTAAPGGTGAVDTGSITSNANFVNLPAAGIGGFNAAGAAVVVPTVPPGPVVEVTPTPPPVA